MRIADISAELLDLMYASGCRQIGLGIESSNNEGLKSVYATKHGEKGIFEVCNMIKSRGIQIQGYFIIGLPSDNVSHIMQTIDMIKELLKEKKVDFPHISLLVPYPGTDIYENSYAYSLDIFNHNFDDYVMNCDLYNSGYPVYNTKFLSSQQLYSLWLFALATAIKHCKRIQNPIINLEEAPLLGVKLIG